MQKILEKYYKDYEMMEDCRWSTGVLKVIETDIDTYCKPYDDDVRYAGRGNSKTFSFSELLVPELGINPVFYVHDCMYELWKLGVVGYTKTFADDFMDNLMEMEGFVLLDDIYHLFVDIFG